VSKPGSSLLWRVALASSRLTKKEEGKGQKTQKRKNKERKRKGKKERKKPISLIK
jgi:hypothetical protein